MKPARTAMTHASLRATLAALAAATVLPAAAQSADFSTWQAFGDVTTAGGVATLTTAAFESGEAPASGHSALLWPELEAALGTAFDADTFEGSALQSSFMAAAGTKVTLQWSLVTEAFDPAFADRLYAVIDGQAQALAQATGTPQQGQASFTFATGGTHTLAFAVLDVNDTTGLTSVSLSGLAVTPAVPEPAPLALLLAGLAVVAARRRARPV